MRSTRGQNEKIGYTMSARICVGKHVINVILIGNGNEFNGMRNVIGEIRNQGVKEDVNGPICHLVNLVGSKK